MKLDQIIVRFALLVACLCCNGTESVSSARANRAALAPARITVDAGKETGATPYLFRAGLFTFSSNPTPYVQKRILKDFKLGTIEIDLGREVLAGSVSQEDVVQRIALMGPFLQEVKRGGGEVVLGFSKMPRWLSARPNDLSPAMPGDETPIALVSPPKDYEQWASLVGAVVAQMDKLGIDARYKIGWEPDTKIWQGTEDEFFKLYRASVLGARRVNPKARIGGPGVSDLGPHWRNQNDAPPMAQRFLEYCSQTSLPEVRLNRLPVDFLAVHLFGGAPGRTHAVLAGRLEEWLTKYGFDPRTELLIGEWSDAPDPFSAVRDEPYMAAFIVASLLSMDAAGFDRHAFTSLTEQQTSDSEFSGGFGLFTKNFVTKPSYYAFDGLGELGKTRVAVESPDPYLCALAARDEGKLTIVVANFVPAPGVLVRDFIDRLMARGHTPASLSKYFRGVADLERAGRESEDLSRYKLPAALERDIKTARSETAALIRKLQPRATAIQPVVIDLRSAGWLDSAKLVEYRIDGAHSNPIGTKSEIDRSLSAKRKSATAEISSNLGGVLKSSGYTDQEISHVQQLMGARDKQKLFASLSKDQQRRVLEAVRSAQTHEDDVVAAAARVINDRPQVRLAKVRDERLAKSDTSQLKLDLEANSVAVIVLTKEIE